jgi:hypothetical protein
MNLRLLHLSLYFTAVLCLTSTAIDAQQQGTKPQDGDSQSRPRDITSDAFTNSRPAGKDKDLSGGADDMGSKPVGNRIKPSPPGISTTNPSSSGTSRKSHKLVRVVAAPLAAARRRKVWVRPRLDAANMHSKSSTSTAPVVEEQVGITLWRLRPSGESDSDLKFPVRTGSGATQMWRAERAGSQTRFAPDERVRLTIESPRNGYLYVIDREQYSDGTLGDAMMVFPTTETRNGDNQVKGGVLVDIPDQHEQFPYFLLKSDNPKYAGELLTVIVSLKPIPGINPEKGPIHISRERLEQWEEQWGAEADLYEEEGGAGRSYTLAEREAGAGGVRARQLKREDPLPQTIFRVKIPAGASILIPVLVEVGR